MSDQRSADWYKARAGCITASRFKDVIARGKSGYLKARSDYLMEIVTERLTGEPIMKSWGNSGEYGTSMEDYARLAYEAETGIMVLESDFILHSTLSNVGCSPDGLIGEEGGEETKCPSSSLVHLTTILNDEMPPEHMPQVQGNMACTGRAWWDFVSYDGRMPDYLRLFITRIERDNDYIKNLENEIKKFDKEVSQMIEKLLKHRQPLDYAESV